MSRRITGLGLVGAALAALASLAPAARAQDDSKKPEKTEERRATALEDAFDDVVGRVAPSVVEVLSADGDELGFAVAVLDGTYLLTTRSMLVGQGDTLPAAVGIHSRSGKSAAATIAGSNEAFDVALLKIVGSLDLRPLPLGKSHQLAIGEWVISVGMEGMRPLAVGVVSAVDRRVEARPEAPAMDLLGLMGESRGPQRDYARVIQHDSPFDGSRDSGSPLVDADGRLVGINLACAYRGSVYAAPIDDIAAFLDDLKAGKPGPALPRPGFIGVMLGNVKDPQILKSHGIEAPGAYVTGVADGKPAAKAGVKVGDIFLTIDGRKIESPDQVGLVIREHTPGEKATLVLLRNGKEVTIEVAVAERPED